MWRIFLPAGIWLGGDELFGTEQREVIKTQQAGWVLALVMIGALLLERCGEQGFGWRKSIADKVMESYESLESYEFVADAAGFGVSDPESGETVAMHNTITGAG